MARSVYIRRRQTSPDVSPLLSFLSPLLILSIYSFSLSLSLSALPRFLTHSIRIISRTEVEKIFTSAVTCAKMSWNGNRVRNVKRERVGLFYIRTKAVARYICSRPQSFASIHSVARELSFLNVVIAHKRGRNGGEKHTKQ